MPDFNRTAHDPEKHVLDLIGDGNRFSEKIMRERNMNCQLFQRPAGHGCQFAHKALGYLAGHWQSAIPLEFFDRALRRRIVYAGRLDLPVTEIGQRALDREHLLGWRNQFGDGIVTRRLGQCGSPTLRLGVEGDDRVQ